MVVNCICCNKEIELIQEENPDLMKVDSYMWSGGMVGKIDANYGSVNDSDVFIIGLCDECTNLKLKDKSLTFLGNYLFKTGIFEDSNK